MQGNLLNLAQPIPVCRPKLPLAEQIFPYLQEIDHHRWYSNYGPLTLAFHSRLADLFNLQVECVTSAMNGTVMLELCLKAMDIKPGSICLLPSWTFVATPLAVNNAQLEPLFIDVDQKTQMLDPEKLEKQLPDLKKHGPIGAVIVVSVFGAPINCKAWDQFTERTGIPVVIDAAASFDTILQMPEMAISNTPVMVSLHATKVLGVGEGAMILSQNKKLINQIMILTQFGFDIGVRDAVAFGSNAKISEYTAAVGLAALDQWQQTRSQWQEISHAYQVLLNQSEIAHLLSAQWVPSTCNVLIPFAADFVAEKLQYQGIITRKWWGNGCHRQTIYKQTQKKDLPNTDYLVASVLGLPFFMGMTKETIEYVISKLIKNMESCQYQIQKANET